MAITHPHTPDAEPKPHTGISDKVAKETKSPNKPAKKGIGKKIAVGVAGIAALGGAYIAGGGGSEKNEPAGVIAEAPNTTASPETSAPQTTTAKTPSTTETTLPDNGEVVSDFEPRLPTTFQDPDQLASDLVYNMEMAFVTGEEAYLSFFFADPDASGIIDSVRENIEHLQLFRLNYPEAKWEMEAKVVESNYAPLSAERGGALRVERRNEFVNGIEPDINTLTVDWSIIPVQKTIDGEEVTLYLVGSQYEPAS